MLFFVFKDKVSGEFLSDHFYSSYLCAIFQYEYSLQPINLTYDDLKIQVKQIYD